MLHIIKPMKNPTFSPSDSATLVKTTPTAINKTILKQQTKRTWRREGEVLGVELERWMGRDMVKKHCRYMYETVSNKYPKTILYSSNELGILIHILSQCDGWYWWSIGRTKNYREDKLLTMTWLWGNFWTELTKVEKSALAVGSTILQATVPECIKGGNSSPLPLPCFLTVDAMWSAASSSWYHDSLRW